MVNEGKRPMSSGEVRFLAVARMEDRVVVASYTHGSSSRHELHTGVLQKVLRSQKTVTDNPRLTITDRDVGTVHYDTDRSAIYVAITAFDYPQRTAFKCLGDLMTRFQASFGDALHKSAEGGISKMAKQIFAEICATYADAAAVDKTLGVLKQVEEVKGIMHDSINEMLATRDNLEVLEDKTEALRSEAATFQRQAVTLKRSMWWRNMKLKLLCGVVIIIVLAYVLLPQLAAIPGFRQAADAMGVGGDEQDEAAAPNATSAAPAESKETLAG
jgi:vesicle-associated membrane protein 7